MLKICHANNTNLKKVVNKLISDDVVILPTETVYGIAANALSTKAVEKIYKLKNRPTHNPLILHFSSLEKVEKYAIINDTAKLLAKKYWPGPLTLILKKKNNEIPTITNANLDTIAVRIPQSNYIQNILKEIPFPLAIPSANHSGYISSTNIDHVKKNFSNLPILTIDSGPCKIGIESTIINTTSTEPIILRPGAITSEMVKNDLDILCSDQTKSKKIISPGQLTSHYSPNIPLKINVTKPKQNEAFICFGTNNIPFSGKIMNLSNTGSLEEAAKNLYPFLYMVDNKKFSAISIVPIPNHGIGIAINNRLKRASSSKIME